MADINSNSDQQAVEQTGSFEAGRFSSHAVNLASDVPTDDYLSFVELLFFAYRDFTGEADALLDEYGFGRAHHRVLHFVNRNPGLCVADLLDILKITKQSLARVLKQLVDESFVEQRAGASDRRQRLLFVTEKGCALARQLAELQADRLRSALAVAGPDAEDVVAKFLLAVVSKHDRAYVSDWIDIRSQAQSAGLETDQVNG
ncbi:MAG: MarR family winged helix-turn-helix transcriptional regulator [Pseudomonadota bacterium]